MDTSSKVIVGIAIAAIVLVGGYFIMNTHTGPGELDQFAICLKDKGAIFYGAFWCPHCQATKKLFGVSANLLPYVECSTPDGQDQTQICKDKKITSYPTWVFPNGVELVGEHSLQELSQQSGCPLPGASTSAATSTPAAATSTGAASSAE